MRAFLGKGSRVKQAILIAGDIVWLTRDMHT